MSICIYRIGLTSLFGNCRGCHTKQTTLEHAWTNFKEIQSIHIDLCYSKPNSLLLTANPYTRDLFAWSDSRCLQEHQTSLMFHPCIWRCCVTPNDPFHPIVQRRDRKNSKRQLKDWLQCYIAIDWIYCRQCKDPVPWIDTSHRHSSCGTYLERQQPLEIDENPLSVIVSIDVFGLITTCWILPHILDLHIDFFDQCLGLRLLSSLSALSFSSFQTRQTVSAPQFLSSK